MTITELNALPPAARAQEILKRVRLTGSQLRTVSIEAGVCIDLCFCTDCLGVARAK